MISLIFAYAEDAQGRKVIGKDNKLPWRCPSDMNRFRQYTSGHPVIMGRLTYESIGRCLPKRENIVITRNSTYSAPGAYISTDFISALELAKSFDPAEIFIIGGASIYKEALPVADRLYITKIEIENVKGDAFFPDFTTERFELIYNEKTADDHFQLFQKCNTVQSCGGL